MKSQSKSSYADLTITYSAKLQRADGNCAFRGIAGQRVVVLRALLGSVGGTLPPRAVEFKSVDKFF